MHMQAVGTVSAKLRRGKHTTRSVRLLETRSGNGMLADTPGFNQPSLEGLSVQQLPDSFPEIRARLETARHAVGFSAGSGIAAAIVKLHAGACQRYAMLSCGMLLLWGFCDAGICFSGLAAAIDQPRHLAAPH